MTVRIMPMSEIEAAAVAPRDDTSGLGCLRTEHGNLPLESVDASVSITGLLARTVLTQGFRNPHPGPVEATYIFPLPDRAAVTAMRLTAADRVVDAELHERGQARAAYDQAIVEGRRAAIAEQERADVFTMRVGNILPGERVSVALTVVGPLSYEDGEATYRLPLVVAPRYIPGAPLPGTPAGDGYAPDTDAVPDASRITPPVLLPGFPNPVALSIGVDLDPAGLPLGEVRSSLHAVQREGNHLAIEPGERLNRDFILRLGYGSPAEAAHTLTLTPDADPDPDPAAYPDAHGGTFRLTVLPPTSAAPPRPRDVVLVLDRSGSMQGWKMVAARRAAARIVDTLSAADRFSVLTFDHAVESPAELGEALVAGTDRHRFQAVRHLAGVDARGGTELLAPLARALELLPAVEGRDRVLVLVTDGQVGNEDQIIAATTASLRGIRVHTVGIDQAVNAGFLGRLAAAGAGRCELVESEDRLDEAMDRIHRRIAAPVVVGLTWTASGFDVDAGTVTPARLPDLFPGVPLVVSGRYTRATDTAAIRLVGRTREGGDWPATAAGNTVEDRALTTSWARAYLGDLEDRFAAEPADAAGLERTITKASLRFGVLCRFTAWLAVDSRVVNEGGTVHRITQPVEQPAGWDMPMVDAAPMMLRAAMAMPMAMPAPGSFGPSAFGGARPSAPKRARGFVAAARASLGRSATDEERSSEARVDPREDVRAQLRDELDRLRDAAGVAEMDRRELLADLGTRLRAVVQHLADRGVSGKDVDALRDLIARLDEDTVLALSRDAFNTLWQDTIAALGVFGARRPA